MSSSVLHLCSSLGMFGGENVLISLAKEMQSSQFIPIIGVLRNTKNPHTEIADEASRDKIDYVIFPCNGRLDLKTIFQIREYIKSHKIKIIHSHDFKSDFYGFFAALLTPIPIIATCHNWIAANSKASFYNYVDQLLLRYFDFTVAVSPSVKNILLDKGVSHEKIAIISNGVFLENFHGNNSVKTIDLRLEFGIPPDCPIVGTVGRLSPEKGYTFFLRAANEVLKDLKDVYFLIVGDGPQRQELINLSSSLGIERNVIFAGIRTDIARIYSLLDIFVISSVMEGLPMVLLEALASHKSVVATNVGAIPQVIEHEVNGLLVEPGNIEALVKAIRSLLENKCQAENLAQRGYEKVSRFFSARVMADKYIDVYQKLFKTK